MAENNTHVLLQLQAIIRERLDANAQNSYVASLCAKGDNAVCKKIAEEACEVVMAAKDENADEVIHEVADLWFHCLILLTKKGISISAVYDELQSRQGLSGLVEKQNRINTAAHT